MDKRNFKIEYCKMCDKQTNHEVNGNQKTSRCLRCLWTTDCIEQALNLPPERWKGYGQEIYVAGDPDN